MYRIDAIAFHAIALRRAKAIITHLGFHATPSGAWPEGCATQLVNPLNAFSLGCGPGIPPAVQRPSPRSRRAVAATRLPAPPCHAPRWTLLCPPISWRGRGGARLSPLGDAGVPRGPPARDAARAPPWGGRHPEARRTWPASVTGVITGVITGPCPKRSVE